MTVAGSSRVRLRLLRGAGPAALALVLVAGLSACGSDSDGASGEATGQGTTAAQQESPTSAGTTGTTDPCSFLTTAEISAAGIKAADPQPVETATGGLGCNYFGDDPLKGVQVMVQPGGGQAYFDQSRDLLAASEPLSGLGDEAVLDASNPQQTTVLVLADDTVLSVGGSITAADAQSLTEKALRRLDG